MTRQGRWLDLEWLPKGELQSDALLDLKTEDNKLSVYKVDGVEDTERVVIGTSCESKISCESGLRDIRSCGFSV